VKSSVRDRSDRITRGHDVASQTLAFGYEHGEFRVRTTVRESESALLTGAPPRYERVGDPPPARVDGDDLVWNLELQPRQAWTSVLRVGVGVDDRVLEPLHKDFGEEQEHAEGALTRWLAAVPRFRSDNHRLRNVFRTSVLDLAALRVAGRFRDHDYVLPAGLPWFMTLFGRDTIITALEALWEGPELARGALWLLAGLQGRNVDGFRDEEPGKILHEIRQGELTVLGEMPYSPYYGTIDATPLWIILLSEYWRFSGDDEFVRSLWVNAVAAVEWIDRYGDRDGDGYVEYQTRSPQGLGNQCWKDSWDGIRFADGDLPYLPIATAETQGYVYDAKLRMAELAEGPMGQAEVASRLRREAKDLRDRFERDYWSEERGGYFVVGLDGDKRQIDSVTSNMGHLLWSGIVSEDRARIVAGHLFSDDMFSGWGVRTMSRQHAGYNPIGYHVGTVWPHDNTIVAMGLARYGCRDEANRIITAQLEAAGFTGNRLPEAFAGYDRSVARFPVPYPTACSPQAWATGAPFVFISVMLGLGAHGKKVSLDPHVPDEIGAISIDGVHAFGTRFHVEARGMEGTVEEMPEA
jgi:glycogen debranching enzyme